MALTPEQTSSLVHTVLNGPTIERASALFQLVRAVSDPEGNSDQYECAVNALRAIDPLTREYEAWFQGRISDRSLTAAQTIV